MTSLTLSEPATTALLGFLRGLSACASGSLVVSMSGYYVPFFSAQVCNFILDWVVATQSLCCYQQLSFVHYGQIDVTAASDGRWDTHDILGIVNVAVCCCDRWLKSFHLRLPESQMSHLSIYSNFPPNVKELCTGLEFSTSDRYVIVLYGLLEIVLGSKAIDVYITIR
jgi:hypothetical protein